MDTDSIPKYPKINALFKRDTSAKKHHLIWGDWCEPIFADPSIRWNVTEKVDGINIRLCYDSEGKLTILGRNNDSEVPRRLEQAIREKYCSTENATLMESVIVFGEGYGYKIGEPHGSTYLPDSNDFVFFGMECSDPYAPFLREDVELVFKPVPFIGGLTIQEAIEFVETMPCSRLNGAARMEGVVGVYTDDEGIVHRFKLRAKDFKDKPK